MIINKRRFSQIRRIQKDSYKKMRLSRQFPVCLFFLRKNFKRTKTQIKPNQLTEQKQENKKQQRQQFFVHKNF